MEDCILAGLFCFGASDSGDKIPEFAETSFLNLLLLLFLSLTADSEIKNY